MKYHEHKNEHKNRQKIFITLATIAVFLGVFAGAAGCSPKTAPADGAQGQASGEASGSGNALDAPYDWSMQSDCATCHTTEASGATDSAHAQAVAHAELSCTTCHTEESVLKTEHAGITLADTPASKPSVLTVAEQTCVGCHGDLAQMAGVTAASEALRDDQGLVVNPHQRPEGATHAQNPATCTSCHNNHSETLARDAKKYCTTCHHRGVWQCGTCHPQDE